MRLRRRKLTAFIMAAAMLMQLLSGVVLADEAAYDNVPVSEQQADPASSEQTADPAGSEAADPAVEPVQNEVSQPGVKETVSDETPEEPVAEEIPQEADPSGLSDNETKESVSGSETEGIISGNDAEDAAGADDEGEIKEFTDERGDHWIGISYQGSSYYGIDATVELIKYLGSRKDVVIPEIVTDNSSSQKGVVFSLSKEFDFGENRNYIETVESGGTVGGDNVTSILGPGLFKDMKSLRSVNLDYFDSVNFKSLFEGCTSLETVYFGTSHIVYEDSGYDCSDMFSGCTALKIVVLPDISTNDKGICLNRMFKGCTSLERVDVRNIDFLPDMSDPLSCNEMFSGCENLKTIYNNNYYERYDWSNHIGSGTDMFKGCRSLVGSSGTTFDEEKTGPEYAHVDGGQGNPGYFTDLMLTEEGWEYKLDGSNYAVLTDYLGDSTDIVVPGMITWQIPGRTQTYQVMIDDTSGLFSDEIKKKMTSLRAETKIVYPNPDPFRPKLSDANVIKSFFNNGAAALQQADLSGFELLDGSYENLAGLFEGCTGLERVVLPAQKNTNFKLVSITDMFKGCKSLQVIDFSSIDMSGVNRCGSAFEGCESLRTIYVDPDMSFSGSFVDSSNMFKGCVKLKGMKGTVYRDDDAHNDGAYARIDGGSFGPGFFSTKYDSAAGNIDKYTYGFINTYGSKGLGYEESWRYHIPEERYQELFDKKKGSSIYRFFDDEWGGSCFGISATSSMFNHADDSSADERHLPSDGLYQENGSKLSDIRLSSEVNSDTSYDDRYQLYYDLRQFIEAMQIAQYDERVQFCYSLDAQPEEIVWAIDQWKTAGNQISVPDPQPVIIGMFGPEGGHAVLGYAVERSGSVVSVSGQTVSAPSAIHIYDSNWPGEDRFIELRTGSDGSVTGWHYDICDTDDLKIHWGTDPDDPKDCVLTYIPYDVFSAVWKDGGNYDPEAWAEKLWNLIGGGSEDWSDLDEYIFTGDPDMNEEWESFMAGGFEYDEDLEDATPEEVDFFLTHKYDTPDAFLAALKAKWPDSGDDETKQSKATCAAECAAGSCMRRRRSKSLRTSIIRIMMIPRKDSKLLLVRPGLIRGMMKQSRPTCAAVCAAECAAVCAAECAADIWQWMISSKNCVKRVRTKMDF